MSVIPPVEGPAGKILEYRADARKFLAILKTKDEADKLNPIKRFPINKPHLYNVVIPELQYERLLAIVKHRRLQITWTVCGMWLWGAMLFEGRFNALISKKEEDSDELVRRCHFMWETLTDDELGFRKPRAEYKYTTLEFPDTGSTIKGVAQGRDQLRQYTCSRVACDEIAFWQNARDTFVSLKPTIEGGGQIALISTRYPGFFKELIEDTLEVA